MKVAISEIFESIQGEGRNVGKPSIFIRFFGCNLHCKWCDTEYSWKQDKAIYKLITIDDIVNEIQKSSIRHIIFTGGEPLLFQKQIKEIQKRLKNYTFEVETNGSIGIKEDIEFQQINVSPKLSNSGNSYYDIQIKDRLIDVKFVIGSKEDIEEAEKYLQNQKDVKINEVIVMPLGTTVEEQIRIGYQIIKDIQNKGWRLILRQHILLFGNKLGT